MQQLKVEHKNTIKRDKREGKGRILAISRRASTIPSISKSFQTFFSICKLERFESFQPKGASQNSINIFIIINYENIRLLK